MQSKRKAEGPAGGTLSAPRAWHTDTPTTKKQKTDTQVSKTATPLSASKQPLNADTPTLPLPPEVLVLIFSLLPHGDVIYTIPLVSKVCQKLCKDSAVYRTSVFRNFPWTENLDRILRAKGTPINEIGTKS